ncbi:hypothetical protein DNAM5_25 [Haloarcula californiae tailed virus 1]|uniref:Uncharacterized protein n=1 Tax=Haloarcula californiae tailed virus 1 TaxID=1273746 RepID=R4TNU5_9CAUD|nr:hypothetical protein M202_gp025 [Haloarcula californiae tailed virus 1]AGM11888.1 hypothetical protein DNAM5_25 [Haloarcula californiae tailed virus 1]
MTDEPQDGVIVHISPTRAQHGVIHAEPCDCTDIIQVGGEEERALKFVEDFVTSLAAQHNCYFVGCKDCGWEGFFGPGPRATSEDNKAVVAEASCPECSGDIIDLQNDDCDHETEALDFHYDENELLNDDD